MRLYLSLPTGMRVAATAAGHFVEQEHYEYQCQRDRLSDNEFRHAKPESQLDRLRKLVRAAQDPPCQAAYVECVEPIAQH